MAGAADSSRWTGFYRRTPVERAEAVAAWARLEATEAGALRQALGGTGGLPTELSASFIENAVGSFPMPLGFAVNFVIDGVETVVPMAVEESSVVAAASHAAKLVAMGGGFRTSADEPVMIGQVEVRDLPDPAAATARVRKREAEWVRALNESMPAMVRRGGGVRGIESRIVGTGRQARLVVHLLVDVRDAMGANLVNTLCESFAPTLVDAVGGRPGLRILSNLADRRLATAECTVPAKALRRGVGPGVGPGVAAAIVEANDFARLDPYRAATHNKGILNGIDPVVIATGNDWRAVEAGANAYAARDGQYRALTEWTLTPAGDLSGRLTLPMALGTVGGVTRLHPVARACLAVLGRPDAQRLARIVAAAGLAQNLAALRALSAEGIQAGHMALHARNLALAAGATPEQAHAIAERMVDEGDVSAARARRLSDDGR